MRLIKIPKGGGRVRLVYSPGRAAQSRLRQLLPLLQRAERRAASALGVSDVAHGFVRGRSPVTMAERHIGYAVTISCDLAGWFDHVSPAQIARGLEAGGVSPGRAWSLARRVCCRRGEAPSPGAGELAPRQGLCTSPTAANLAAVELDRVILAGLPAGAVYTRYADDLVVSLRDPAAVASVLALVESCASAMGWPVAQDKTRVQYASVGRRIICGVSVGESSIRAPRSVRRRLRAARHQGNTSQAQGLAAWCAMTSPRSVRRRRSPWQDMVRPALDLSGAGKVKGFAAPRVRRCIIRDWLPREQNRKVD